MGKSADGERAAGRRLAALFFCAFTLLWAGQAQAQLRLSSLAEIQSGRLPADEIGTQRSLYQQLNLAYAQRGFELSLRGETFGSSEAGRNYGELVQRSLRYQHGRLEAGAGHFDAILGEGLLLHAFELPGVLTEDRGWRRRYQLTRDLDGVFLRYNHPRFSCALLRGAPLNSALPPGLDERRGDPLRAASLSWRPTSTLEGGAELLDLGTELGASTHLRLRPGSALEIYAEYAQRDAHPDRWLSLGRDLGRGLYLSSSLTTGPWGVSLEYKNYRNFLIADINDPPPLIREHEAYLLNRLTHVLFPGDETGAQLEGSYTFAGGRSLLFNHTLATRVQEPGRDDDLHLRSYFLQFDTPLGNALHAQAFADLTRSDIIPDDDHLTLGSRWEWQAGMHHSFNADLQFQGVDPHFYESYTNLYLSLGWTGSSAWSAAVVLQRTTDTLESGASPTGASYWTGFNAGWQVADNHRLDLFAGQRRTGLACTAGTCHEVLGFEGVELRLMNQFR